MHYIQSNQHFLSDLFGGPFRGHALFAQPALPQPDWLEGDFAVSDKPVKSWAPFIVQRYETSLRWHEELQDDSVPYAQLWTGTELFAAAFGCSVHKYRDAPPCALPLVTAAEEADLLPMPGLDARPLERVFEMGEMLRERLGDDVPISVPDIQSPFDIAALIWNKEDLFVAMHQNPDAVFRLVDKCHVLLKAFLREFKRRFPNCNLCHCPTAWAPPELGCWLSEDEAGSMSVGMFRDFCLPTLMDLSESFGGLFMHCCATADHQYGSFRLIPNLRGLNRVFQSPGPMSAIEAFSGHTVLMVAWTALDGINEILDMALPDTRFLFNIHEETLDAAKASLEQLRRRCPRV